MPTLGGIVRQNAWRVPSREAVVAGDVRLTWRDLEDRVARAAGLLEATGVRPGDRVAIVSGNCVEHIVVAYAALRLAAIVVPVNARLAVPELAHVIGDCDPRVIAASPDLLPRIRESVPAEGRSPALFGFGASPDAPDLTAAAQTAAPVHEDRAVESDDAYILYTSGTTGHPKGALFDHHRAVWAALAQLLALGIKDGDRYLHLPPLYHSGGVVYLNATTLVAGTNILVPEFDPELVFGAIERERATAFLGVPTMYQVLLDHPRLADYDLSSWRIGVFGGAPMPAPAVKRLTDAFPGVEFFQQCGQTEAGPTGLYSTMTQIQGNPDSSGHLGQPFVEARVIGDGGAAPGVGAEGELQFRGEAVMKGYWNNPDATATTIVDSWLRTGDVVRVLDDGYLLVDRLKDVIITGGRNVYSAEVEQALAKHPDIADCAVIGRPHEKWGETVVAVLTLRDGAHLTIDDLRAHCRPLIADYKIPRELTLAPVPRTASGKVRKHVLREMESSSAQLPSF